MDSYLACKFFLIKLSAISTAFNAAPLSKLSETIHKFKELDRWIPLESKYKRFDLNKLENFTI